MKAERYGMLKVRASMGAYFCEQLECDLANTTLDALFVKDMQELAAHARVCLNGVQRLLRDNRERMISSG